MFVRDVLVPLDASVRDRARLDAATSLALSSGARVTLLLPRTTGALRRLEEYARGEDLTAASAGEQYAARSADWLSSWGIDARGVSCPSTDPARDIAWFARRHDASLILVLPLDIRGRLGSDGRLAQRLLRLSSVPVLAVPSAAALRAAASEAMAA